MPSIVSIDCPQLTATSICEHLTTSPLLAQLLRQLTIDRILSAWEPAVPTRSILADPQLDLDPTVPTVTPQLKLQQFKQENWGHKVGSYYLTRKTQLDRIVCSLIQVADGTIAQELYFRICTEPKIFSKLALNYSQGTESFDGGKIGPIQICKLHPTISTQLLLLEPGQISPLFTIDNFYIFVRLERVVPAQFDDELRQLLLDELFEQWLQAKTVREIGHVSMQSIANELN